MRDRPHAPSVFERKDPLFDALEQQAGMVHDVASTFSLFLMTSAATRHDAEEVLARVEANAARATVDLEQRLGHAFTLQIDREDLHELSNALRSVLLLGVRAVRTALSVGTEGSESLCRLADMIVQSAAGVVRAVERLRTYEYAFIWGVARELRALQRLAREAYDQAVAALLGRHDTRHPRLAPGESRPRESQADHPRVARGGVSALVCRGEEQLSSASR